MRDLRITSFAVVCAALCIDICISADPVPLWGRWEGVFTAGAESESELELAVELTSPSGARRDVAGFWDGGRTWRARFMPGEEGEWRFRTRSRPPVSGLDGQEGRFECRRAPAPATRFARHGAIRVAASGTHLEHADGTPYFWLGDTAWNGAILGSEGDWARFLDDRVAKGFTGVQFVTMAPWRTAPADERGEVAFTGRENVEINPSYFQRLDRRIDAVEERGLLAAPVLIWSLTGEDPGRYLPIEDVVTLVRYQVARYGAHHVMWILAGDNPYSAETAPRWKLVGRAVFGAVGDAPRAPVTTHPTGMNWPWEGWRDEKWLDVLGYQSGHGDDARTLAWIHSGPVTANWTKTPTRPIINLEPPYEDHIAYQSRQRHTAYTVRRAVWWSLLCAPTAGVTYGGHGIWSWQTVEGQPPRNHERTGVAKIWHRAMHLPGTVSMRRVAEFFGALPWWTLRPADDLLAEQPGKDDPARFVAAARSQDGAVAVLYLPVGGEVTLRASVEKLDLTTAQWFDPRSGERREARPADGARFEAPDGEDWVLVLSRGG